MSVSQPDLYSQNSEYIMNQSYNDLSWKDYHSS